MSDNGYWVSRDGLRIPKSSNALRQQWDADYLTRLKEYFGPEKVYEPASIPVASLTGGNTAVNHQRKAFYSRLYKLGEKVPPVLVQELKGGFYSLIDGSHRHEAAREAGVSHVPALIIRDAPKAKKDSTAPHVFTGSKARKLGAKKMKKSEEPVDITDFSKHERTTAPALPDRILHALWAIRQPGVLTDELRNPEYRSDPNPFAGHCFVATNALFHLIDGPRTGWEMKCIHREHLKGLVDDTHWFLQHKKTGHIIDPTADQFDNHEDIPYEKAVGKGTSQTGDDVGKPTKRAQKVIDRARAVMAAPEAAEVALEKAESSPEFEAWFAGSKAVDPEGKPLKFYHGTSKDQDFHTFKTGQRGAWFTDDPEEASLYAQQNDSRQHKLDRYTMQYREVNTSPRVIPVHLSIKNPYQPTEEEFKQMKWATNYAQAQRDLFNKAKRLGHDGANMGAGIWVAFNPNQIKSVFNVRPTAHPAIHKTSVPERSLENSDIGTTLADGTVVDKTMVKAEPVKPKPKLQAGTPTVETGVGQSKAEEWDYSHLLPEHARQEGYRIRMRLNHHLQTVNIIATKTVGGRTRPAGQLAGRWYPEEKGIVPWESLVEEQDRGHERRKKGLKPIHLGTSMYEALYAHGGAHLGVKNAVGSVHSTAAHHLHKRLAAKYDAKPNINRGAWVGRGPHYSNREEWEQAEQGDFDGRYAKYKYKLPDVLKPKEVNSFADHTLPGSLGAEGYRVNIAHAPHTTIATIHRRGEVLGHVELTPTGHAFEEWTAVNNRTGLRDAVLNLLRGHAAGEAPSDEWNEISRFKKIVKAETVDMTDLLKTIRPVGPVELGSLDEPKLRPRPFAGPNPPKAEYGDDSTRTYEYTHLLPPEARDKYRLFVGTIDTTHESGYKTRHTTASLYPAETWNSLMGGQKSSVRMDANHVSARPDHDFAVHGRDVPEHQVAIEPHISPLGERRAAGLTPYVAMALLAHARNHHGIRMLQIPEHTPAASNMIRRYLGLIGANYQGQPVPNPYRGDTGYEPFLSEAPHLFSGQKVMLKAEDEGPADGSHITTPHASYTHGATAKPFGTEYEGGKNVWGRGPAGKSNAGRTLMVQFSTHLLQGGRKPDEADAYYDKLYSKREGYHRGQDFWEVPQWQAHLSHSMPDADHYTVRDPEEAIRFLQSAGYKHVAFSALDVNKDFVRRLAEGAPNQSVVVGGYTDMAHFQDLKNVKVHQSIQSFVESEGLPYQPGYDYKHFTGMKTLPRLTLSDGCRHQCTFCCVPKQVDEKSREEILQQADAFAAHLPSPLIYLNDKTYGQAKNHAMLPELYQRIKAKNPAFQGFVVQTTAAQMKRFTPEFIQQAGIKHVELGVESVNDHILKAHKKPATEAIIEDAANKIRQAGASLIPNIMVGLPGEDRETYGRTMAWLQKHRDIISHVNTYNLALYDDSELGKKLQVINAGDRDENVQAKSWHTDPQAHADFAKALFGFANGQLDQPIGHSQPLGKAEVDHHDPVSVVVMVQDGLGRTLWGKRKDGKYTMPAGHADARENPVDAAIRELHEEAGLTPKTMWLIGSGNGKEGPVHFYHAICSGTPRTDLDPDREMAAWEWHDCLRGPPPQVTANLAHNPNIVYDLMGWPYERKMAKGEILSRPPTSHGYHYTHRDNIPSIVERGLVPQRVRSYDAGPRVWFSDEKRVGIWRSRHDQPVLLRFPWPANAEDDLNGSVGDWTTPTGVQPGLIEVRQGKKWNALLPTKKSETSFGDEPDYGEQPEFKPDHSYERRFPLPEYSAFGPKDVHREWNNTQYLDEPSRENPGERKSVWDLDQRDIDPIRVQDFKKNAHHLQSISRAIHKMVSAPTARNEKDMPGLHLFAVDEELPKPGTSEDWPGTFTSQAYHSSGGAGNFIAKQDAKHLAYLFGDTEALRPGEYVPAFETAVHEMMHGASGDHNYDTHDDRFMEEASTEVLAQYYTPKILRHSHDVTRDRWSEDAPLVRIEARSGEIYLDKPVSYHGWVEKFAKVVAHIEGLDEPAPLNPQGYYSDEHHTEKERKLNHMVAWYALKLKQMGHDRYSRSQWLKQMWIHRRMGRVPPKQVVSHPYYGIRNRLHDLLFDPITPKYNQWDPATNTYIEHTSPRGLFHHSREMNRETLKGITKQLEGRDYQMASYDEHPEKWANPEEDPYAP